MRLGKSGSGIYLGNEVRNIDIEEKKDPTCFNLPVVWRGLFTTQPNCFVLHNVVASGLSRHRIASSKDIYLTPYLYVYGTLKSGACSQ